MKIGILHLTDSHIKSCNNWIEDKFSKVVAALKNEYEDCDRIYIVFTGDIAFSGKKEEYSVALSFLNSIRSLLKVIYGNKVYSEIIVTPGNHDCDFTLEKGLRKSVISRMNYEVIGNDNSVIEECLSVQTEFWAFMHQLNSKSSCEPALFSQFVDRLNDSTIIFNCYNTAWMSSENESVGTLFFPTKKIPNTNFSCSEISISIFHHHFSWLNPNTTDNNKSEFRDYIYEHSDLVLFGHEHEQNGIISVDPYSNKENYIFGGESLQATTGKNVYSGFQSFIFDLKERKGTNKSIKWDNNIFSERKSTNFNLKSCFTSSRLFTNKIEYLQELNTLKLPLVFNDEKKIHLKDIFIFPDLEKKTDFKNDKLEDYVDSYFLVNTNNYKIAFLEGDNQSGKSSLLNMLYLSFTDQRKYPIMINGKSLKKGDLLTSIKKSYEEQYDSVKTFEEYSQSDNNEKILLVDNINQSEVNNNVILELLRKMETRFSTIIVTTSAILNYSSLFESEIKGIFSGKILPLGRKKRNKLIEMYHRLNEENPFSTSEAIYLERTRNSYDQIQIFLGNKLIPSHPVFILSMLQTISLSKPSSYEQTSYGYCYQSLIHYALSVKAKVKYDDFDTYSNFLSELAFSMFEIKNDTFSEAQLNLFYRNYTSTFLTPCLSEIKEKLLESGIIIKEEESYKFAYNYIYYFLVARKIAEILSKEKGKAIVRTLCKGLHNDKNANILIFITHHSKDSLLIDETILSSMITFEKTAPITLDKNDPYYSLVKDIIKTFKDIIIPSNVNPIKEREKRLESEDKLDKEFNDKTLDDDNYDDDNYDDGDSDRNMSSVVMNFHQAVRSLEIVGQIIKNRKGSIPLEKLEEMIKELYLNGFRTIGFFGEMVRGTKDELAQTVKSKIEKEDSLLQIENRIDLFFQLMSYNICLAIFSKIINSVGHKDLRSLFDKVAEEMNTPAAKLVTFSIKTSCSTLSIKELKSLVKEYEKNPVAIRIIKSSVNYYLYNNFVDYKDRQQISSCLKMPLTPYVHQRT